ncbi:hypothetical protein PV326_014255 [Microctonus aethiopoides]|nr:hypothetical protein PV326_014255 [Microctonus aethiopoides]
MTESSMNIQKMVRWLPHVAEMANHTIINGEMSRFSKPLRIFTAVMAILIMITGLLGNLLTIIALSKYPKVRNVTAAFIIRFIDGSWTELRFLCVLVPFLRYGNVGVSLLCVGAITINRYIMITHHSLYNRVYKKHWIALMILFCYTFSYGMQIPTLIGVWGQFDYDPNLETCSIIKDSRGNTSKAFLFVTGFIIPCIVIVGCYTKIFWVVHSSETRMRKHANPTIKSPHTPGRDTREIRQRRSEWRITKMVLAIFLSFLVCYLPITIVKVTDPEGRFPGFHVVGYLFLYFAACINPIIYVIMNKQYRQAYASVICCSKIRASLTPRGSSAPGQTDFGQGNHHPVKDYSRTMVSTVSIVMDPVIRKSDLSDAY